MQCHLPVPWISTVSSLQIIVYIRTNAISTDLMDKSHAEAILVGIHGYRYVVHGEEWSSQDAVQ